MKFSRLTESQRVALGVIYSLRRNHNAATDELIEHRDARELHLHLQMMSKAGTLPPSEVDLATVLSYTPGLFNAQLFLMGVDLKATDEVKTGLREALETCCWDKVAEKLVTPELRTAGITFGGDDLHHAFAPADTRPCKAPAKAGAASSAGPLGGALDAAIGSALAPMQHGQAALGDLFQGDIGGFLTEGMRSSPIGGFAVDFGGHILSGDIGGAFTHLPGDIVKGLPVIGGPMSSLFNVF